MPFLLDSSVYVSGLRKPEPSLLWVRTMHAELLWLSAVVLQELYAGAGSRERTIIERLERDFAKARRILVPSLTDWTQVGRVLAQLAVKYGYDRIGRGRLVNDALIAMSAGRQGITVLTVNERDFAKLAEFRPFRWRLHTTT
jgi:predicted nucleic acid-binding protein